jgi:transcriptional regulator with AAA-type ATPase domain
MLSVEANLLREAVQQAGGDRAEAARLLGVTPRSLRYLLKKHPEASDKNRPA